MPALQEDANFHWEKSRTGTALAAGAVGVVTAGTISGTTSAGAAPTVAIPSGFECNDKVGTFELTPVTGGGAQAAGSVATVRFVNEYAATPKAVIVNGHNVTDTTAAIVIVSGAITSAGFNIYVGTALTTAKAYRISYVVIP